MERDSREVTDAVTREPRARHHEVVPLVHSDSAQNRRLRALCCVLEKIGEMTQLAECISGTQPTTRLCEHSVSHFIAAREKVIQLFDEYIGRNIALSNPAAYLLKSLHSREFSSMNKARDRGFQCWKSPRTTNPRVNGAQPRKAIQATAIWFGDRIDGSTRDAVNEYLMTSVCQRSMIDDFDNADCRTKRGLTNSLAIPLSRRIGCHRERRSGQNLPIGPRAKTIFDELAIPSLKSDEPLRCVWKHDHRRQREERDRS